MAAARTSGGSARKKAAGNGASNGTGANNGNGTAGRRLVIVESPGKARKIASYLGCELRRRVLRGHIRDLPRGAADVPAKYKGEPWARLGVNTENDFEPLYVVSPEKRARSPS